MYFITNRSDTGACVFTNRENVKSECSSSNMSTDTEINKNAGDFRNEIATTEINKEKGILVVGRTKELDTIPKLTQVDNLLKNNVLISSNTYPDQPHRPCSDVSAMFDIINETTNNIESSQSPNAKNNSQNIQLKNLASPVEVYKEYTSIKKSTSKTNRTLEANTFPNIDCVRVRGCSKTVLPVQVIGAATKIATVPSDQELEIADELRSIMAEVEETVNTSSKDLPSASLSTSIADPTTEMDVFPSSDIADKDGIDLCSKMETIIAAATKDKNDPNYSNMNTGYDFNIIGPVTNTMDSNDTSDFSLPDRLYNFIAEATEGMNVEDVYITVDRKGENQHSELSNLVADTFKRLETEVAELGEKDLPDEPADCSGIIAMDLGPASIYLSSIDKARKAEERERLAAEAGILANEKFTCYHCSSKWSDYYMVKYHIIWNHIPELEKKQIYRVVPNMNKINLIKRIFAKFQALKEGRKKGKRYLSAFKFRIMLTKRKIKYYKCRQCDFTTPKEYDMRKHKSMKHDKPLFQCDDCSYCTTVKSCLLKHVMAKHTKEKPHKCEYCNYCATQYNTLQEHIMAKHTFEKPHECPHCDYASVQKSHLQDHIKCKHTHERNRCCPDCDYMSVSSATLRRHIMAKHTHEKPYKCKYCGYSATQSGQLRKHVMAIHTYQKPFHCQHCSYKATQSCSLKIHVRRKHLIHKPYQCNSCKYKCSTNTYLKHHIENKHKSNSQKILKA